MSRTINPDRAWEQIRNAFAETAVIQAETVKLQAAAIRAAAARTLEPGMKPAWYPRVVGVGLVVFGVALTQFVF